MSSSITERILGNNNIYTDKYYKDTILLTKSIVVVSSTEAKLYNEYVFERFKVQEDKTNPHLWRYYRHLEGSYHSVDTPMVLTSLDSGAEIILDKVTIDFHRTTRDELLKFDYFYKELVDRYPDQELLIKSIINKSDRLTAESIVKLDNYTIVSYNSSLVEERETNLIPLLQLKINKYKVTKMLPYYAVMESYYMASMFQIFYNFIFTSIISIRLGNAKTQLAHSYHILNYLASHHKLDKYFNYLTKKQILFLYRNLLYLNNHSGRNHTFKLLIEKLFTEKKVSVVNYRQKQKNSVNDEGYMNYRFNQVLMNDANLVFDPNDFTLEELRDREVDLLEGNVKEYEFNESKIDLTNRNSLDAYLITKDLEINLVDNTNDVKHKLIPTIIDYWGHLLSLGKHNFLATVIDPVTNTEYNLNSRDMFKLFTIVLHKQNNETLTYFPDFVANRVYKSPLPTQEELSSVFYKPGYTLSQLTNQIRMAVPSYSNIDSPYSYNLFITKIYNLNLGLWLFISNQGDKDLNAQLDMVVENLHRPSVYSFNNEEPENFLRRIGFLDVVTYNEKTLTEVLSNILNAISYNKIGELGRNKLVQEALVQVFKQFNSYTTQIIDKYFSSESILANLKSPLYTLDISSTINEYYLHDSSNFVDLYTTKLDEVQIKNLEEFDSSVKLISDVEVNLSELTEQYSIVEINVKLDLVTPGIIDLVENEYTESLPDQETLLFLSSVQ